MTDKQLRELVALSKQLCYEIERLASTEQKSVAIILASKLYGKLHAAMKKVKR